MPAPTYTHAFCQGAVLAWPQGGVVWLNFIYSLGILLWGLSPPFHYLQFQYGGDSQKGPVVSPMEAQAQAILQQTQVHFTETCALAPSCSIIYQWLLGFLFYAVWRPIHCILKVKHKPPSYVCFSAVTKGTSRSTGSTWAAWPTCKALLWPWPNLDHY